MELPDDIYEQIETLSEAGNEASEEGDHDGAIAHWRQALALLPEPVREWEAYEWLQASIGDSYYQMGDFEQARENFFEALSSHEAQENAFAHYMLGKTFWRLEDERAVESLLKAYMLEGVEIFDTDEPEGPEVLRLLEERGLLTEPDSSSAS